MKILFLDIDGTVLSHTTNTIPSSALKAINTVRKQGIKVFGCTGRHALELEKEVYELRKKLLGEYDKKTIISLANLASCYHRVKNYHQAITLGKSAYEKAKQKS